LIGSLVSLTVGFSLAFEFCELLGEVVLFLLQASLNDFSSGEKALLKGSKSFIFDGNCSFFLKLNVLQIKLL